MDLLTIPVYQVDAFTDTLFEGNPAAVCPLEEWLPDSLLQAIAFENNLSETAFLTGSGSSWQIRWFTPTVEVDLCGHATLAAAFVLHNHYPATGKLLMFDSRSGPLEVEVLNTNTFTLNFPLDTLKTLSRDHPVSTFFNPAPTEVFRGKDDYLLIYRDEAELRSVVVDFEGLRSFDGRGVVASARGNACDFVVRGFYPQSGIDEDPATGSAQTTATRYWAGTLKKSEFTSIQVSKRMGYFRTRVDENRCFITGQAVPYLSGQLQIER